jgi:RNA ligase
VEIIYPANRIVCDYGDRDELVLLGGVWIDSGEYVGPLAASDLINWEGRVAQTFPYPTLQHALEAPPRPGMEGLCVRYLDEPRIVKIKQEDYVALHRIVTGLSERTVWETMCARQPHTDLLDGLPDELHPWVVSVWDRIAGEAEQILGAVGAAYTDVVETLGPEGTWARGDFAAQAKARPPLTPYLFQLLDGRDPYPAILKTLRPHGDTRARARSEAIA